VARVPVLVGVGALDEVVCEALDPVGAGRSDGAGVELRRLNQLGGHHPLGAALEEGRAGEDAELAPADATVLPVLRLDADVAEQPRQQRAVDRVLALARQVAGGRVGSGRGGVGHGV
jgi:hypothetical protein